MTTPIGDDKASPAAQIARDMRAILPETRKQARPALRRVGEMVAATTRANAAWSTRIPGTVKVIVSFRENRESVKVRAGGPAAPHARPYEDIDDDGQLAHPVHGHAWIVIQQARPSLFPAAEQHEAAGYQLIVGTLNAVGTALGFR